LRSIATDATLPLPDHCSTTLRGTTFSLVSSGNTLLASGTVLGPSRQRLLAFEFFDIHEPLRPHRTSSFTVGSDWTWTPAMDDTSAIAFKRASLLASVAFTSFRFSDRRYTTGAYLMSFAAPAAKAITEIPTRDWVERATFVNDYLITLGPQHVESHLIKDHEPKTDRRSPTVAPYN